MPALARPFPVSRRDWKVLADRQGIRRANAVAGAGRALAGPTPCAGSLSTRGPPAAARLGDPARRPHTWEIHPSKKLMLPLPARRAGMGESEAHGSPSSEAVGSPPLAAAAPESERPPAGPQSQAPPVHDAEAPAAPGAEGPGAVPDAQPSAAKLGKHSITMMVSCSLYYSCALSSSLVCEMSSSPHPRHTPVIPLSPSIQPSPYPPAVARWEGRRGAHRLRSAAPEGPRLCIRW